jgi:hypothetical protein
MLDSDPGKPSKRGKRTFLLLRPGLDWTIYFDLGLNYVYCIFDQYDFHRTKLKPCKKLIARETLKFFRLNFSIFVENLGQGPNSMNPDRNCKTD